MLFHLLYLAGIAQIALVLGSTIIPKVLDWKTELAKNSPLIRQMFWTYAGYILVTNLSFGILSVIGTQDLLNKSLLAKAITLFIAVYWITRIALQFFYFDMSLAKTKWYFQLGEYALIGLFLLLSFVYSWAFLVNILP